MSTSDGPPVRPYSAPDQLGGATPRTAEMITGFRGDPDNAATSLNQDSQRWNLSSQFRPTSVLQPLMSNPGGNGMSAADAARRLPTGQYLGSVNGTSSGSFEPSALMRLNGQTTL